MAIAHKPRRHFRRNCRICGEAIYLVVNTRGMITLESCGCRPKHCSRIVHGEDGKMELMLMQADPNRKD